MRGKSHITLGHYLIRRYMQKLPQRYHKAFLRGCIQPDRNPATYLKGSFRCQWLRGHNYPNASRFMSRISHRLHRKERLNLFDYYTLGKLIHYTADAFTFAHNEAFPANLSVHRSYEETLQNYFLHYLSLDPFVEVPKARTIMESIRNHHGAYSAEKSDIYRDSRFALQACCCVVAILLTPRIV